MRIPQQVIGSSVKDIIYDVVANYLNKVSKGNCLHEFVGKRFMSCSRCPCDFHNSAYLH
jgi:hypothetical protein